MELAAPLWAVNRADRDVDRATMRPLQIVERAHAADATEFTLANRGDEWLVSAGGRILMSSRMHHSEEELARRALMQATTPTRVLIGGLGMGYTAAAALQGLGPEGHVTVAELLPALVEWNRTHLGHLAGHPLRDARCEVVTADVFDVISRAAGAFDVIVLDVDNGPIALSSESNQRLYSARGVRHCLSALRPGGILGVWSAAPSATFEQRLRGIGTHTEVVTTPAHPSSRSKHTLFFTRAPLASSATSTPRARTTEKKRR